MSLLTYHVEFKGKFVHTRSPAMAYKRINKCRPNDLNHTPAKTVTHSATGEQEVGRQTHVVCRAREARQVEGGNSVATLNSNQRQSKNYALWVSDCLLPTPLCKTNFPVRESCVNILPPLRYLNSYLDDLVLHFTRGKGTHFQDGAAKQSSPGTDCHHSHNVVVARMKLLDDTSSPYQWRQVIFPQQDEVANRRCPGSGCGPFAPLLQGLEILPGPLLPKVPVQLLDQAPPFQTGQRTVGGVW